MYVLLAWQVDVVPPASAADDEPQTIVNLAYKHLRNMWSEKAKSIQEDSKHNTRNTTRSMMKKNDAGLL